MNIIELFQKAQQKLYKPKFIFESCDMKIKIHIAAKAHYPNFPNYLYISKAETGDYLGKFLKTGEMILQPNIPDKLKEDLVIIKNDPIEFGKLYGQKYSFCCFCGTEIVTKESLTAGYGPICAEKWGLPWGSIFDENISKEELMP
jgi:hypothetical protein